MEFKVIDATYAEATTFDWRLVGRNAIRFNITLHNMLKDIHFAEAKFEGYRRYATWQRLTGSMWENLCDIFDPKISTPVFDVIMKNLRKYTNFGHPCPYLRNETLYMVADRLEVKDMHIPFIPSGQYRVDMTMTDGKERHPLSLFQFYFDISDHRVKV